MDFMYFRERFSERGESLAALKYFGVRHVSCRFDIFWIAAIHCRFRIFLDCGAPPHRFVLF